MSHDEVTAKCQFCGRTILRFTWGGDVYWRTGDVLGLDCKSPQGELVEKSRDGTERTYTLYGMHKPPAP